MRWLGKSWMMDGLTTISKGVNKMINLEEKMIDLAKGIIIDRVILNMYEPSKPMPIDVTILPEEPVFELTKAKTYLPYGSLQLSAGAKAQLRMNYGGF